jgi:glutamate racemase
VDALVLGCTHYPLLRQAIADALPGVELLDSAGAVAGEVAERLGASGGGPGSHSFFVTDVPAGFLGVAARFLGQEVAAAEQVDI